MQGATAQNFYISAFYQLAVSRGLDAGALLERANIPSDVIDVPEKRIEAEKLADFIIAICDELQDESMGLSSSPVPRGTFYMMGKLTIHEPTLAKALLQIIRFFGLVTKSLTLELKVKGSKASLMFELQGQELDPQHLFAELNLLMFHRYSSWLIAESIPLKNIYFSYPPPAQVKEYGFLFPGRHVFNAPAMGFSFPKCFLDRAVMQNPGTLKSFMRRCPMELFVRPKDDFSLTSEVHFLLSKHLNGVSSALDEVANALHVSKRTLIRKLQEEGSSFQEIKDHVRRDRAIYYLTSQSTPVGEIAGKVGFSDPSVFTRAFRAWTGVSPGKYRADYMKSR